MFTLEALEHLLDTNSFFLAEGLRKLDGLVEVRRDDHNRVWVNGTGMELLREYVNCRESGMEPEEAKGTLENHLREVGTMAEGEEKEFEDREELLNELETLERKVDLLERENSFLKEELEKEDERVKSFLSSSKKVSLLGRIWHSIMG